MIARSFWRAAAGVIAIAFSISSCTPPAPPAETDAPTAVASILGADPPPGYERITGPAPITFPPDHGAHPEQQIEWWYTTANLETETGARFGVEVTFFRFGLDARTDLDSRESAWATRDLHMAHFALTDARRERFHAFERFSRGAAGLAGAEADPWRVWNESWSLVGRDGSALPFPVTLQADGVEPDGVEGAGTAVAIDLTLSSRTGPVLHGDGGFSRKGPEEGAASRYYSYPSLEVSGEVIVGKVAHRVHGTAWFDHEWSTSVLGDTLEGWDWFALQFSDGGRLMLYQLRRRPDALDLDRALANDRTRAGTWISPAGEASPIDPAAITITPLETWRSSASGIEYPALWRLEVSSIDLTATVRPILPDQELRLSTRYWEGAVDVAGTRGGTLVTGRGYVELVGYGESAATPENRP